MSLAIALGRQAEGLGGSRGHRRHRTRREHRVHSRVDDDGRRAHDTDWADPERDAHRVRGQRADNPRHHIHGFRIPTMLEAPRVGAEVDVVRRRSALCRSAPKGAVPGDDVHLVRERPAQRDGSGKERRTRRNYALRPPARDAQERRKGEGARETLAFNATRSREPPGQANRGARCSKSCASVNQPRADGCELDG